MDIAGPLELSRLRFLDGYELMLDWGMGYHVARNDCMFRHLTAQSAGASTKILS